MSESAEATMALGVAVHRELDNYTKLFLSLSHITSLPWVYFCIYIIEIDFPHKIGELDMNEDVG